MDTECILARTQALLLLASLLGERSAADSVWEGVRARRMTPFLCFLLQSLETDELGELKRVSSVYSKEQMVV